MTISTDSTEAMASPYMKDTPVATAFGLRLLGQLGAAAASATVMISVFGALNGNILVGPEVPEAMGRAFEAMPGELAEKLFAALKAGDDAGARLAELHATAGDLERKDTPDGVRVMARLPAAVASRYQEFALSRPLA